MTDTMNINAPSGSKVIFNHPTAGYPAEQELAKKHLVAGETYTVDSTDVDSWHTTVRLVEVPDVGFNSVLFDDA